MKLLKSYEKFNKSYVFNGFAILVYMDLKGLKWYI